MINLSQQYTAGYFSIWFVAGSGTVFQQKEHVFESRAAGRETGFFDEGIIC